MKFDLFKEALSTDDIFRVVKEVDDAVEADPEYAAAYYRALVAFKKIKVAPVNEAEKSSEVMLRLLKGLPLTPLHKEDPWIRKKLSDDIVVAYNKRYPPLQITYQKVNDIYKRIKITDENRINILDLNAEVSVDEKRPIVMQIVRNLIDELFPITFPYYPESVKFLVLYNQCVKKNGNILIRVQSIYTPYKKKLDIYRYYCYSASESSWREITVKEYVSSGDLL